LKGALAWSKETGREFDKRDLTSNINFFMNVPVTPEGKLSFEDGVSDAGKYVEVASGDGYADRHLELPPAE
jgi:uncharacterized protein YcgI (DUF1989 family)